MVSSADAGPLILIRRLRQIMAEAGSGQERLDKIVRQIANIMVADVCSIYIRRQDGSLELFATEGLNKAAVHNTHMARGEGLVGLIAESGETVNLSEAQEHPAFSYRPETGEEIYHSFLGVPVQRGGNVVGVLVVQNRTQRLYDSDEQEALQTTAMVLAEHFASGAVAGVLMQGSGTGRRRMQLVKGQTLSDGIALGHVVLHEPRVVVTQLVADDVGEERKKLARAIKRLRIVIDAMLDRRDLAGPGEHREVLESYRMFAHDSGWIRRWREAIGQGLTAEAAVERVRNETRARMLRQPDSFWRERFKDLDDLSDRLLRTLSGRPDTAASDNLPEDTILVARNMGPAELLDYDRNRLRGLVVEEGSLQSHVAIVAKALGIAAIGHAKGAIESVEPGEAAIIDAETGELHIRPGPDVIAAYSDKARFRARRQQRYAGLRDRPAVTKDGVPVSLKINAGLLVDLPHIEQSGADGIGLFRTELEFMIAHRFPLKDRQTAIYRRILDGAGKMPVVFRTLDIGGDKLLPYFKHVKEENPALGWRALRMTLDRKGLLKTQVQALLRAASGRELQVMLPMVSSTAELEAARKLIADEQALLKSRRIEPPASVKIGAMNYPGDADWTVFSADGGTTIVVDVHSVIYRFLMDPVAEVYDAYGHRLCMNDDMDSRDSRVNILIPASGVYFLKISDYTSGSGMGYFYIVSVTPQFGTGAPTITQLKFKPAGMLKKVVGTGFNPAGTYVEVDSHVIPAQVSAAKPTTVMKVKPTYPLPPNSVVTTVLQNGRRSNPALYTGS